ncbi:MAG: DUF4340 domain-containing protein [Deltaproteobacteria bacterium]|nr:DUF4340 domain-containing protein [Deltaproteobacteria bacterium]
MKFKATWMLLAVFAALGSYLVFVEEPRHRAGLEAAQKEGLLLPGFQPDRVTEVSLEGNRGSGRLAKSADGRWELVSPVQDRANDGRVRGVLEDLKALKAEREVAPAGADLTRYGLTSPMVRIRTVGSAADVAIGAENPAADGRYLRVGGGPVQVVKAYLVSGLLQGPKDLRSKEVLPTFPWNRLQSVSVAAPGTSELRLVKVGTRWRLAAPVQAEADPDAAERLAEKLRWSKIATFLDTSAEAAAPRLAPGVTVTFTAEGEPVPSAVRLAEVGKEIWVAAGNRRGLFTLPRDAFDAFRVAPASLERTRPILTKTWSAQGLELTAGGGHVSYTRQDGTWRRGGQVVRGEESSRLQEVLEALESTAARRLDRSPGPPARYGLDAPSATVTLSDSQQGRQTLTVGEKAGTVYARSETTGPVYEVPAEYLTRLEALGRAAATAAAPSPPAGKTP